MKMNNDMNKKSTNKIKRMLKVELGIIVLLLIILIIIKSGLVYYIPECIIHRMFGILCPSCQGTRCVMQLVQGNFAASFNYHPIFFITIMYLLPINLLFIINSFKKKEILTFLYPNKYFLIGFIIILAIFTVVRNIV